MGKEELKPIDVSKYTVTESGNVIKGEEKETTKEELEKEAEECMHNALFWLKLPISKENVEQGGSYILKLLEPREKQIDILSQHILELQADKGRLTDRVKELEAQIEKMKCCTNCKHSRTEYEHCKTDKHEKWEIKEK